MIEKVKLLISMCFFGTSYVSLDIKDDFVKFFISAIAGILSLLLIYKINQLWQHQQNSQHKQMHLPEPKQESSTSISTVE